MTEPVLYPTRTRAPFGGAHKKKIAKAYAQNLKKLATPEERQVMGDEAQDVYNQRSDEKQRKEKQAELDARLKEEKERTEKRRKQNMALLAKTHAQRGSDWRAAERRILSDEYFPEVSTCLYLAAYMCVLFTNTHPYLALHRSCKPL